MSFIRVVKQEDTTTIATSSIDDFSGVVVVGGDNDSPFADASLSAPRATATATATVVGGTLGVYTTDVGDDHAGAVVDVVDEDEKELNKWHKNAFGAPVAKQSGKFSKEESELVRKSVEEFCAAKQITTARLCSECGHKAELKGAWMEIAKSLPHRSVQSVYRHGIRRLHPFKRGCWDEEECNALVELVATMGKKWSTIQGKLNRSADSCRDKYREMSDEYIKGRWKEQETDMLKLLIWEQVGVDQNTDMIQVGRMVEEKNIQIPWSHISKRMGRRSRLSCFKKWQKLIGVSVEEEDDDDDDNEPDQDDTTAPAGRKKRKSTVTVVSSPENPDRVTKQQRRSATASSEAHRVGSSAAVAETGDFDYAAAKIADETVEALGLPDARSTDLGRIIF